jgi:hypothetical protein
MYSVGLVKWLWSPKAQHDFVKELPRERLVYFGCRPIWTSTTLVMLTPLCIGDARSCASTTRSHGGYGETVVERAERKKEEEEKRKKGSGWPYIPPTTRTFLKLVADLHLPSQCQMSPAQSI